MFNKIKKYLYMLIYMNKGVPLFLFTLLSQPPTIKEPFDSR